MWFFYCVLYAYVVPFKFVICGQSAKSIYQHLMSYNQAELSYSRLTFRIAVAALFFLQGIAFASWASRIPSIQQSLGLSEAALGIVLLSIPVGLLFSIPFSGWFVAKFGSRKVVLFALVFYSLSLISLGLAATKFHLMGCLFLFGFCGNMSNIAINTQAVGVEAIYARSVMASFHGMWSVAGFTAAAIGTVMIGAGVLPYQHFIIISIFILAAIFITFRYTLKEDFNKQEKGQKIFVMPDKSLLNLGLIAFCSMICEGAMFDWSGVYFKKVVMAEKAWIGAGYTAFMSTMATGRFIADWFTSRFGVKRTFQLSGMLTASGLMVAVVFPHLITAMIGFFLVGFGVSSIVPLVYSAAGKSKVMSAGVAIAAVSTIGFFGFLIGPPLIGMIAGISSLRISFVVIAAMGLSVSIIATFKKFE
jgi:MFS family permease